MLEGNDMTLKSLFEKYYLIIPDYQREYAQGRDNSRDKKVLEMFIKTISDTLKEGSELSLDYVYGNIKKENGVDVFFPVDGQQRLTILFLFYVYCYQGIEDKEKAFLYKFKYAVNPHTNSFIELLLKNGASEPEKAEDWRKWIAVMSSIHLDSCALSLLNAYREIQRRMKCEKIDVDIDKLEKISFQFLDTQKNDLPESIFWKMNARGRQLTDSEIFKAAAIKLISDNKKKEEFATGFSNLYSKVFNDLEKDLINADKCVMRLVKSFCQWRTTSESKFGFNEYVASSEYEKAFKKNDDDISVALPRFFNFFKEYDVRELLPKRVLQDEKKYILDSLSPRIISAMIIFFRSISNEALDVKKKFECWMRLSINFIDNSQDISALKSVLNTLSDEKHIASIETASVLDDIKCDEKDVMLTEQIKEEKFKAKLITGENGSKWQELLYNAENHNVLRGKVSLLFTDGEKTDINSFNSNFDYLDKLWSQQANNYILTRILLYYYESDLPKCDIDMRCSNGNGEAAKKVLYGSLAGCFRKAAVGKIPTPEKLNLSGKPYWVRSLCKDGKILIDSTPKDGNVYSYYNRLVVLRNGKRIDTYGNIIFDEREVLIAKLIKDKSIKCLYPEQQIKDNEEPTNYFKGRFVLFIYRGQNFELYYYPFGNANDVYLLKNNLGESNPYCEKTHASEFENNDDSQKYYCFRFGENPTEGSIKASMDRLIEEGLKDNVIEKKES